MIPGRLLRGLERRARSLRRRLSCFDRRIVFSSRPRRAGSTDEGSPLFEATAPWRFRIRGGWPEGAHLRLRVAIPAAAGPTRIRLRTEAGERTSSVSPGEWVAVHLETPGAEADASAELCFEPSHPAGVRVGEIHLVAGELAPVLRNLERVRAAIDARGPVVDASPSELTVETSSACNLRCVMCPQAVGRVERPKHLPEPLLERVAPALERASEIQLHGIGEPLLSPAFWRALEVTAGQQGSEIGVNTNLTTLGPDRIERILASNLSYLNVSLDAATPETFRKIRGFDFATVLANVRALVAARDARGLERPLLYVNMTLMLANLREAPDFVSLARELGAARVYLWHLNEKQDGGWKLERDGFVFDYDAQHPGNAPELSNRMIRLAVERAEKEGIELALDHNRDVYLGAPEQAPEAPAEDVRPRDCTYPWRWLMVTADGAARPCCFIQEPVGNLNQGSFDSVWNGEGMQAVRRSLARDELHPSCREAACKYAAAERRRAAG